jgi:hypothetical protein
MDQIRENLINQARRQFAAIYPCGVKKSLADCFTQHNNRIVFWFNTEDHSTHALMSDMIADQI